MHYQVALNQIEALEAEFEKLLHVLSYVKSSGELNDSVYAYAVSRGENLSSRVLSLHLKHERDQEHLLLR